MLLAFISIVISLFSTFALSYLSMVIDLGPWVAPVFVIAIVAVVLPIAPRQWFKNDIVLLIASASLGGMIGQSLGWTFPAFYFLEKNEFLSWLQSPVRFASMIFFLITSAGFFAFIIANILRTYVLSRYRFPMSELVYNLVYIDKSGIGLMLQGILSVSIFNILMLFGFVPSLLFFSSYSHIAPLFSSIGFLLDRVVIFYFLIGAFSRFFMLRIVKDLYFIDIEAQNFIVMFISGMLLAVIVRNFYLFLQRVLSEYKVEEEIDLLFFVTRVFKDRWYVIMLLLSLCCSCGVLWSWNVSLASQVVVYGLLWLVAMMVVVVMGSIGVVELETYASLLIVPLLYFFKMNSESVIAVFVFCAVVIGLVADLLFSYKLADLAGVAHKRVLRYQILGFITASFAVGFILWWWIEKFSVDTFNLIARQAFDYSELIAFNEYNIYVVLLGFLYAMILAIFMKDLFVIMSGMILPLSMSFWIIASGFGSSFIKNKKRYQPVCLGVYAAHSLWLLIRGLISFL